MSSGKKGGSSVPTERTSLANPITTWKNRTGKYPSNAQSWWVYKRPLEVGSQKPNKYYQEVFDPSLRYQITLGNTPAPKGHYLLNAFQQDRSAASSVPNIAVKSAKGQRPTSVAFYAGRIFYAGVKAYGFNTKIYFSQILERDEQIPQCYQSQDPTNEDLHDLLATDGGVIVIPEIQEVVNMTPVGYALYVEATNGVWRINGAEGTGFRANDYTVSKVSGTPAISSMSFVDVEGSPMWWNRSGIWTIQSDQMGQGHVQSLTEQTIKTFYLTIPEDSKFYAKGAYDPLTHRVQWLYRSTDAVTSEDNYKYDSILTFDTLSGAFYHWKPADNINVELKGIFSVSGYSITQSYSDVTANADLVTVSGDQVQVTIETRKAVQSKIKYIVNVQEDTSNIPEEP